MLKPPLRFLHDLHSLSLVKLAPIDQQATEQILRSLKPENKDSLKVRFDGTVLDGHHRLYILRKRGIDIDDCRAKSSKEAASNEID